MSVIIRPIVSEKMTAQTEKLNRYGFICVKNADKLQIRKEIEELYGVNVVSVNTIRYAGKKKSRYTKAGFVQGRTNAYKKAIVSLKEGQVIDFYSNI